MNGAGDRGTLRRERSDHTDARLAALYADALVATPEAAGRTSLVAVGGYGRRELSPHSDLDVVLLHEPAVACRVVARLADALWYPLWDDGTPLDHAVRDTRTVRSVADRDWRAALGMLDARHVAGQASLALDLRTAVLTDWRRAARRRLPELRTACAERADRAGDLAHVAVPDLKDSRGGLRDGVVVRALVATWLVDVPHQQAEQHRSALLDVRDALHEAAGRRGDRLHPELLPDVASRLGTDRRSLERHLRGLGRRTAYLSELTWRRVEQVLAVPGRVAGRPRARRPALERLDEGVARVGGEVVLDRGARPGDDPFLGLRAAAVAAERGLLLAPSTAARLAADRVPPPEPWPEHGRRLLVRLLAAGRGLVPVWEELDHAGLVDGWLPEWSGVRLRSSDSAVHRFTVDRHCVETCVQAAQRLRDVARPDLLVVAALLHDIGKGLPAGAGQHSALGAPVAERVARRLGFGDDDAGRVGSLVLQHLLLVSTAVRRDISDPDTVASVAAEVGDIEGLDLLAVLTESDARSAAPAAWTPWRARLVRQLVDAVRADLEQGGSAAPDRPLARPRPQPAPAWAAGAAVGRPRLRVDARPDGTRVSVAARDRPGLLADVAGTLGVAGLDVRTARATTHGDVAVSVWDLDAERVDAARLRLRLDRVLDGSTDLVARLGAATGMSGPASDGVLPRMSSRVRALPGVSHTATVLEVRTGDRAALVWRVCRVLAEAGVDVRSAHVESWGAQVGATFYVNHRVRATGREGRPLDPEMAAQLCARVTDALDGGRAVARG